MITLMKCYWTVKTINGHPHRVGLYEVDRRATSGRHFCNIYFYLVTYLRGVDSLHFS